MIRTYLTRPDGSLYINPAKRHVRNFWLTERLAPTIVVPANGFATGTFEVDNQGHFEIQYIVFDATSDQVRISIFDNGTRRFLMNRSVLLPTIAGTAERPFILPESYFINTEDGPRTLDVTLEDLSGAPNTVRLVFVGRRFYFNEAPPDIQMQMRKRFEKKERTNVYFLTTTDPIVLTANQVIGGAAAPIFEATDEADTEVLKMNSVQTSINYELQFRELRSNRRLSNRFVAASNVFGTGQFSGVLAESLLIERNYDIAMNINELSGAPNTIDPTFICRRLYY